MSHFIERCSYCRTVISQCRCPGERELRRGVCKDCKVKLKTQGLHHLMGGVKDFPEDSNHENGNYTNICCTCKNKFVGHKRRVLCKECLEKKN